MGVEEVQAERTATPVAALATPTASSALTTGPTGRAIGWASAIGAAAAAGTTTPSTF